MKHLFFAPLIALASLSVYGQDLEEGVGAPDQAQGDAGAVHQHVPQPSDEQLSAAPSEDWVRDFGEADKDGDGFLSAVEAREALPSHVLVIDTDNDGQLSKTEVQNAVPGLTFDEGGESSEDSRIGEKEYDAIVQAIEQGGEEQEV